MIEATFGSREAQAKGLPLHFNSPVQFLSAKLAEDVYPLLQTAQIAANAGFWVALMLSYEAAPASALGIIFPHNFWGSSGRLPIFGVARNQCHQV